eukprot:COSAG01_NODE_5519_length_4206_cov_8.464703_7_plen_82_part_00
MPKYCVDRYLLLNDDGDLDVVISYGVLEADTCLISGSALVTMFVVHWTICEKLDEEEEEEEAGGLMARLLLAAPPQRPVNG